MSKNINFNVTYLNNNKIRIYGNINNPSIYKKKIILAPNKINSLSSYSGSFLPFPCYEIAISNTPNNYIIDESGNFNVEFEYPNSYYDQNGITKIISPIIFILDNEKIIYQLKDLFPLKTLYTRNREMNENYNIKDYLLPTSTAENTMKNYCNFKYIYNIV
jgi:hypothetical protein